MMQALVVGGAPGFEPPVHVIGPQAPPAPQRTLQVTSHGRPNGHVGRVQPSFAAQAITHAPESHRPPTAAQASPIEFELKGLTAAIDRCGTHRHERIE
jgi:hypothetical protein